MWKHYLLIAGQGECRLVCYAKDFTMTFNSMLLYDRLNETCCNQDSSFFAFCNNKLIRHRSKQFMQ